MCMDDVYNVSFSTILCVFIGEQMKDKDIHDRDVEMLEQSDGRCFCSIFVCVWVLFQFIEAINRNTSDSMVNTCVLVNFVCLPCL